MENMHTDVKVQRFNKFRFLVDSRSHLNHNVIKQKTYTNFSLLKKSETFLTQQIDFNISLRQLFKKKQILATGQPQSI